MYNAELKLRYIEEKEATTCTPRNYLTRQFNKTQATEERLEKDLCCFTTYETIDFYKALNISTVESLTVLNSHFVLYTDWCLKQNLIPDCQNHFAELTIDTLMNCINKVALQKSIVSKDQLYRWAAELMNPSDAFIIVALFEGIKGENFNELVNLRISDFDGNKVKLCTGRELIVSDKLIELAKASDITEVYYAYGSATFRKYKFIPEDLIIKNYPNCQNDSEGYHKGRRIYKRLMRIFDYFEVSNWMKANSLTESGKIDYINTRSKELGITGKEFMYSEYYKEISERFDCDFFLQRSSFYKKYGEYLV